MRVTHFDSAQDFCDRILPFLLDNEAENNLMIGIALRLVDGHKYGDDPPVMLGVEEHGEVIGAALQTPPYNLQVTHADRDAITFLAEHLRSCSVSLPGVIGPDEAVTAFAECWTTGASVHARPDKALGVYQLDRVIPLPQPTGGMVEAGEADFELLVDWMRQFNEHTGEGREEPEKTVRQGLDARRFWLWNDPQPVSLAGFGGMTPNGIRIGPVFTPPEERGKGYASAVTAALSRRLLDGGRKFCYLFTDLANPTANSIYQKIGYRRVCDFASMAFE